MRSFRILLALSLAALLAPAMMAQDHMQQAPPGTMNYVEGAVSLDGQHLHTSAVGSKVLQPGQVLSTSKGRAEILLTPGVFLRIGHNSAVQMVNPDLLKTEVRLTNGRATVEVDSIYKQNRIEIAEDGVVTRLVRDAGAIESVPFVSNATVVPTTGPAASKRAVASTRPLAAAVAATTAPGRRSSTGQPASSRSCHRSKSSCRARGAFRATWCRCNCLRR